MGSAWRPDLHQCASGLLVCGSVYHAASPVLSFFSLFPAAMNIFLASLRPPASAAVFVLFHPSWFRCVMLPFLCLLLLPFFPSRCTDNVCVWCFRGHGFGGFSVVPLRFSIRVLLALHHPYFPLGRIRHPSFFSQSFCGCFDSGCSFPHPPGPGIC